MLVIGAKHSRRTPQARVRIAHSAADKVALHHHVVQRGCIVGETALPRVFAVACATSAPTETSRPWSWRERGRKFGEKLATANHCKAREVRRPLIEFTARLVAYVFPTTPLQQHRGINRRLSRPAVVEARASPYGRAL